MQTSPIGHSALLLHSSLVPEELASPLVVGPGPLELEVSAPLEPSVLPEPPVLPEVVAVWVPSLDVTLVAVVAASSEVVPSSPHARARHPSNPASRTLDPTMENGLSHVCQRGDTQDVPRIAEHP